MKKLPKWIVNSKYMKEEKKVNPLFLRLLISITVRVLKMLMDRYKRMTPEQRTEYWNTIMKAQDVPRESDR